MNITQKTVCQIINQALFGTATEYRQDIDWHAVLDEMKDHAIENIAGNILKNFDISDDFRQVWKQRLYGAYVRFAQVSTEQEQLCRLLKGNNISFVIVKGLAASQYYPIPECRTLGDIDFIVSPDDCERALELLMSDGYRAIADNGRHIELAKRNVIFEMHRFFSKEGKSELDSIIYTGISNCQWVSFGNISFPCLPHLVNGLVLLQHIRQHFATNGGLGLRQIIDWLIFVDKYLDDISWKEFKLLSDRVGLTQLAITVTRMCQINFGLNSEIHWCENADAETCIDILNYIFESGSFGCKQNSGEIAVITVTRRLRTNGVFKMLQDAGLSKSEFVKKHPHVKPFAWLFGAHFFVRRGFESGGLKNGIKGYSKGNEFDKMLKRLGL